MSALAATSCATLYRVPIEDCPVRREAAGGASDRVVVRYLGAGGFLLSRGEDALMTAPLLSSPTVVELALDHHVAADTDAIDDLLPPEAASARAILVGHSHYYRLLDVPYLALQKVRQADVYGSRTTAHLLAPIADALRKKDPATKVVTLDDTAAFGDSAGKWHPLGPRLRFMAIRSRHAPMADVRIRIPFRPDLSMPLTLWNGQSLVDRQTLPETTSEWMAGTVFSFLIDFLDDGGAVRFRALYVDSAAPKPFGYPPAPVLGGREVDLVLLSGWGALEMLKEYPGDLLKATRPRHVVLSQWENFFVDQRLAESIGTVSALPPIQGAGLGRLDEMLKRARAALPKGAPAPIVPCPGKSRLEFAVR